MISASLSTKSHFTNHQISNISRIFYDMYNLKIILEVKGR